MPPNKIKYVGSKLNSGRTQQGQTRSRVAAQHGGNIITISFPAVLGGGAGLRQTYYAAYVSSASAAVIERRSCSPAQRRVGVKLSLFSISNSNLKKSAMIRPQRGAKTRALMTQSDKPKKPQTRRLEAANSSPDSQRGNLLSTLTNFFLFFLAT